MIEQTLSSLRPARLPQDDARPVLLVEDDTLVAMVVEDGLRSLGFEPHIAGDAAAAVAALAEGLSPALAVIDVGLPDERGDQLAARLRGLYPSLKMIIASGYDEQQLRAQFSTDPGVGVLGKPYTEKDLAAAVRALGVEVSTD
ncbi:MAG: response regulator [Caulobacteraceae bacterium]|nr:response regulator [Caulobacteraceae bacterium]